MNCSSCEHHLGLSIRTATGDSDKDSSIGMILSTTAIRKRQQGQLTFTKKTRMRVTGATTATRDFFAAQKGCASPSCNVFSAITMPRHHLYAHGRRCIQPLTVIAVADTNWHMLPSPSRAVEATENAASHGTAANVPLISCDDALPEKLTVTLYENDVATNGAKIVTADNWRTFDKMGQLV